jgi:hypothetical protein
MTAPTSSPERTKLAFVDCETTGLDPDRHEIWELAVIESGDGAEWVFNLPVDLARADPMGLRIGRYYERQLMDLPAWKGPVSGACAGSVDEMAAVVALLLDGAHLVGAVPSFDAAFLGRWLRAHAQAPTWHYHLIDVEALVAGFIAGRDGPGYPAPEEARPPWDSEQLSELVGVGPDRFDRHTALGDARWAKAIYDAVMGARPYEPEDVEVVGGARQHAT